MKIFPRRGFTLVEVIIVVAVIAILLAISVPNYLKTRTISKKVVCINNLKQIDAAIDQWSMENNVPDGAAPPDEIYHYIKKETKPVCPSGGVYTVYSVGSKPQVTCSLESEGHKLPD